MGVRKKNEKKGVVQNHFRNETQKLCVVGRYGEFDSDESTEQRTTHRHLVFDWFTEHKHGFIVVSMGYSVDALIRQVRTIVRDISRPKTRNGITWHA